MKATQIAQANADAARVRVQAEAAADAEAVKVRTLGLAQADAIRAVNEAIRQGGDAYLALRQLEILPQIVPAIAEALANAKLINISGAGDGRGAAGGATDQITGVIQTLLATQLVSGQLRLEAPDPALAIPKTNGTEPVPIPADTSLSIKRR